MTNPQIFYLAYSHNRPTGGQKNTYRHVDVLNELGYRAFIVHHEKNFRLTWFDNETPVIDYDESRRIHRPEDYFVLAEELGSATLDFPGRKIIDNRNLYYTYLPFGNTIPERYPFLDESIKAMFACSEHNASHLKFAHPHLPVYVSGPAISPEQFKYVALTEKSRVIACSPKAKKHTLTLMHMLATRAHNGLNALKDFEWVFVDGLDESGVADLFRKAMFFIFLSHEEGLPLAVVEAMSSGCLIASYGVGPIKECVPPRMSFEPGDLLGIAQFIESVAEGVPDKLHLWQPLADEGREYARRFSEENLRRNLAFAWSNILEHDS